MEIQQKKGCFVYICVCMCVCERECVFVRSCTTVSNPSDPGVARLRQGASIQCPAVAASFRCQSKSGMEKEVDIACKQVIVVVTADVGVWLCVWVQGCELTYKWSWIFFIMPTVHEVLACRHMQCLLRK